MFRKGLIYERIGEDESKAIIAAINNAKNQSSAKNIIVVVEEEYYYFIGYEDNLIQGISYEGMKISVHGFREEKVDLEKIMRIYFEDVTVRDSGAIYKELKDKCGLNDLKKKF